MVLKRVGVLSCGKVSGLVYALLGLLIGFLFTLFSFMGAVVGAMSDEPAGALLSVIFGVGAVIILPIFYGILGFIGGLITAALYNFIAGLVGGIEVELQ